MCAPRNFRRALVLFLVTLVQFLSTAAGWSEQPPWIALVPPASYTTGESNPPSDVVPLSLPVTLANIDRSKVTILVRDVRKNGSFEERVFQAFQTAGHLDQPAQRGPVIRMTVNLKDAAQPGTYDATLVAHVDGKDDITLSPKITRPAAKLKALDPIVEEVVLPFWFLGKAPVLGRTIGLKEDGGASRLSNITLRPSVFHDRDGLAQALLTFQAPTDLTISPGHEASVPYRYSGPLPLGVSKGKFDISSPNLEQPVTVSWDVHVRRTRWLLFLVLLVGLCVGYVARTFLARAMQVGKARAQGFELLGRIDTELKSRPDRIFQNALRQPRSDLFTAIQKGDVAVLEKQINDQGAALVAALKDLETRRTAAEGRVAEVERSLTPAWSLPSSLAHGLASVRGGFPDVQAKLDRDDVTGAEKALYDLQILGEGVLLPELRKWRQQLVLMLDEPRAKASEAFSESVAAVLKPAVQTVFDLIDQKVPTGDAALSFAEMASRLDGVHDVRVNLGDLLVRLLNWLQDLATDLRVLWPAGPPAELQAVLDLLSTIEHEIEAAAGNPETGLAVLSRARLDALEAAWAKAFNGLKAGLPQADQDEIDRLAGAHDYLAAARQAVKAHPSAALKAKAVAAGLLVPEAPARPPRSWIPRSAESPAAGESTRILRVEQLPGRIMMDPVQNLRQLFLANLLSWLISLVLILVIGLTVYGPSWTGIWTEIVGAFFWAFALDVTIDTVVKTAPQVRK
jgi:hypothetical protein